MKPEVKKEWIELLRSGEIKQANGALNINGDMCCLGVLCEVHRRHHAQSYFWRERSEGVRKEESGTHDYLRRCGFLPDKVTKWAELDQSDPSISYPNKNGPYTYALSDLNDELKLTFEQIADLVEEQL